MCFKGNTCYAVKNLSICFPNPLEITAHQHFTWLEGDSQHLSVYPSQAFFKLPQTARIPPALNAACSQTDPLGSEQGKGSAALESFCSCETSAGASPVLITSVLLQNIIGEEKMRKISLPMYPSNINFGFINVVATPPPCNPSPGLRPLEINGNVTVSLSEMFYQGKLASLTTDQFS